MVTAAIPVVGGGEGRPCSCSGAAQGFAAAESPVLPPSPYPAGRMTGERALGGYAGGVNCATVHRRDVLTRPECDAGLRAVLHYKALCSLGAVHPRHNYTCK